MFRPPFCPIIGCPSRSTRSAFSWRSRGTYRRKCDGRKIKRYSCNICQKHFSVQTFKTDYRWRKPKLHFRLFEHFVSKVTMRQMARIHGVRRPTVERRLRRLGETCRRFHHQALLNHQTNGGLRGIFQLDELETYETDRRLQPVTMPVIIERSSYFVVHGEAAPMGARGNLTPTHTKRKLRYEIQQGIRRSGSLEAVQNSLLKLREAHSPAHRIHLQSDKKTTYRREFRRIVRAQVLCHSTTSSKVRRDKENMLFPINHTFAMMRDCISRLVRRTWAASKSRQRLNSHFWIWVAYRNYIRSITVRAKVTPAQVIGVQNHGWTQVELLKWRWPEINVRLGHSKGPASLL
jgi:transposase-like protein